MKLARSFTRYYIRNVYTEYTVNIYYARLDLSVALLCTTNRTN